jgi:hypothetical protein
MNETRVNTPDNRYTVAILALANVQGRVDDQISDAAAIGAWNLAIGDPAVIARAIEQLRSAGSVAVDDAYTILLRFATSDHIEPSAATKRLIKTNPETAAEVAEQFRKLARLLATREGLLG